MFLRADYATHPIGSVWEIQQDWKDEHHSDADCGPATVAFLRVGGGLVTKAPVDYDEATGRLGPFTGSHVQRLCERMRAETTGLEASDEDEDGAVLAEVAEMANEFAAVWDGKPCTWEVEPLVRIPSLPASERRLPLLPEVFEGRPPKKEDWHPDVWAAVHTITEQLRELLKRELGAGRATRGVIVPTFAYPHNWSVGLGQIADWKRAANVRSLEDVPRHYVVVTSLRDVPPEAHLVVHDPAYGRIETTLGRLALLHLWGCCSTVTVQDAHGSTVPARRADGGYTLSVDACVIRERSARTIPAGAVVAKDATSAVWVVRPRGVDGQDVYYTRSSRDADEVAERVGASARAPDAVAAVVESPPGTFQVFVADAKEQADARVDPLTSRSASITFFQVPSGGAKPQRQTVAAPDGVHTHRT